MKINTSWVITIVAVAAIIGGVLWYSNKPGQYDTFASCIKDSGAKFFGAFWCPHCQEQKALFGKSAKLLPYIECSTPSGDSQTQICKDNDIASYPTWEFPGSGRVTGVLSFAELASSTSCTIVKDSQ